MRKKWRLRHKTNRGKREFPRDKRRAADIFRALLRPYGLAVRTPPFHGGSPGSIPGRVAIFSFAFNPLITSILRGFVLAYSIRFLTLCQHFANINGMKFTAIETSSGKVHKGTLGSVTVKIYEHARKISRRGKRPGTRTNFQVVDN